MSKVYGDGHGSLPGPRLDCTRRGCSRVNRHSATACLVICSWEGRATDRRLLERSSRDLGSDIEGRVKEDYGQDGTRSAYKKGRTKQLGSGWGVCWVQDW